MAVASVHSAWESFSPKVASFDVCPIRSIDLVNNKSEQRKWWLVCCLQIARSFPVTNWWYPGLLIIERLLQASALAGVLCSAKLNQILFRKMCIIWLLLWPFETAPMLGLDDLLKTVTMNSRGEMKHSIIEIMLHVYILINHIVTYHLFPSNACYASKLNYQPGIFMSVTIRLREFSKQCQVLGSLFTNSRIRHVSSQLGKLLSPGLDQLDTVEKRVYSSVAQESFN